MIDMTDANELNALFTLKHLLDGGDLDENMAKATKIAIRAIQRQLVISPIPDENATGIDGKPVPRCQVCGYALDLRMEQYCPCCGQRLTKYKEAENG